MNNRTLRPSLRLSGTLLLVGQVLYIVVTQFHADGPANNHPVVFAEYAANGIWTAVHVVQFGAMAILLAGLLALLYALDVQDGTARWPGDSVPVRRSSHWRCTAPFRLWTGWPTSRPMPPG